jgi:hypothetical protein
MLYTGVLAEDVSRHPVLLGVLAVATLVMLACGLPGDAKLCGDLRPADANADGVVDQHRKLRLGLFSHEPDALDLLEQLRWR